MVEPNPLVKIKRSDQGDLRLQADAELAQLLHQEELAEYDTIQASIDVDALFAARLQHEDREREQSPLKKKHNFL
ncbi:hypothetical protein Tco_0929095 [Tanacetum coccineum]